MVQHILFLVHCDRKRPQIALLAPYRWPAEPKKGWFSRDRIGKRPQNGSDNNRGEKVPWEQLEKVSVRKKREIRGRRRELNEED